MMNECSLHFLAESLKVRFTLLWAGMKSVVDLLPTPYLSSLSSFAVVSSHSLPASLLFLPVMTPLLSALQACCRGDWSKGADERASTITFFPLNSPSLLVPPPFCVAPLDHSPPSTPAFVILLSPRTQEESAAYRKHNLTFPHKLTISRFLLRAPTAQCQ